MISLSELDTDQIKQSFIDWLKVQPIFKDYEYTGSNINVLLDLLARNTNMNAFLLNMVANESFMDTAQIRDAIVSKAKELNYTPRSWRSAEALLDIEITTTNLPATIVTIPSGTAFNSRVDDKVYTFTTSENISVVPSGFVPASNSYVYTFENIGIYEGEIVTETFQVDNTEENQRFVLSNKQIDTSSLAVTVRASNTAVTSTTYTKADTLLGVDEDSTIYFVQAFDGEKYEIEFGDGVLGVKPTTGNIVTVSYRVTAGPEANDASVFTLVSASIGGHSTYTLETADIARGGSESESNDSIKFNAPRHYQTQEAAISTPSYADIIRRQFPEIRAINVYGGEDVTPPRYGYTLISVDLQNFDGVPTAKKAAIESFIRPKMPPMIRPEVIEPDFTYIQVILEARYSTTLTIKNAEDIKTAIIEAITAFNEANLENFNVSFRDSKLGSAIDSADSSIIGQERDIRLYKLIVPTLDTVYKNTLTYQNPIEPGTVESSSFTFGEIAAFLADDGEGNLNVVASAGGVNVPLTSPIGSVDYTNGIISISALTVTAYSGENIKVYMTPATQDLSASQNTILAIGLDDQDITIIPVRS